MNLLMNQPSQSTSYRIDSADNEQSVVQAHVDQLIQNLTCRKQSVEQREAEFRMQVWNWESNAASQQTKLEQKQVELDEREASLHQLHFQMLELQNQIIESQLAIESIVERLTCPASAEEVVEATNDLKYELLQRFDFVESRWSALHRQMYETAERLSKLVDKASQGEGGARKAGQRAIVLD